MVSLRKLAEFAGVSHLTVWRALHEQPGVCPEKRARIVALAEMYHYHPNRLAEGLFSGKTRTIGLIVEEVMWHFYARLCTGVVNAALRDQAHVIFHGMDKEALRPHHLPLLIAQLIEQRVDGIIIGGGDSVLPAKSILEMWSHGIVPVLINDTPGEKPLDRIVADEHQLAHVAVDYLLHLGHQRIAYCGFDRHRLRNQEMARAFHTRGLSLEHFIHDAGFLTAPNPEKAEEYLDQFLQKPHHPTAVICFEDHIAGQLLFHAQHRGLRIPGDLSILGCTNDLFGRYLMPPLTAVEQHPEEIGARAYQLIQRRRDEEIDPGDRVPETIRVSPQLIIRESCGPPEPGRHSPLLTSPGVRPRESVPFTTDQVSDAVYAKLVRLLPLCREASSKRALMVQLGLRQPVHFLAAYIKPALAAGFLERTQPDKPHSSSQRYRLTEQGKLLITKWK